MSVIPLASANFPVTGERGIAGVRKHMRVLEQALEATVKATITKNAQVLLGSLKEVFNLRRQVYVADTNLDAD